MIELFRTAVKEVFQDNFGLSTDKCIEIPKTEGYVASIPFHEENRHYEVNIWAESGLIFNLAEILLAQSHPDEQTLEDLSCELANFIVGHAKMLASNHGMRWTLSTPRFLGLQSPSSIPKNLTFRIGLHCLIMNIGEK